MSLLAIGSGLLTYSTASILRAVVVNTKLKNIYTNLNSAHQANRVNNNGHVIKDNYGTYSKAANNDMYVFNWWRNLDKDSKGFNWDYNKINISIHKYNNAHGFLVTRDKNEYMLLGNQYVMTPHYIKSLEKVYSLFMVKNPSGNSSQHAYSRYVNYESLMDSSQISLKWENKITSINIRQIVNYLNKSCMTYYITAPTYTPNIGTVTEPTPRDYITPSAGSDPASNIYVFFDNKLDNGQHIQEINVNGQIYFTKMYSHKNMTYKSYFASNITDIYKQHLYESRLPLTFTFGTIGTILIMYGSQIYSFLTLF